MRTHALELPKSGPILLPKSLIEGLRTLFSMKPHTPKFRKTSKGEALSPKPDCPVRKKCVRRDTAPAW